ncbi:MAG: hypothetical protein K9J13_02365 [Saprospiraceae bacterium]|nr:hypothetical protein [Saprospiraceae bacterium]
MKYQYNPIEGQRSMIAFKMKIFISYISKKLSSIALPLSYQQAAILIVSKTKCNYSIWVDKIL